MDLIGAGFVVGITRSLGTLSSKPTSAKTGAYTRDRHRWLEGATIPEIMAEVERRDKPAA
jgi:hypothetical protein